MHRLLPKSFKNRYPFKICTTSFIYPDDYVPNVERIGPYMDEVELLFFESQHPQSLPTPKTIDELSILGRKLNITYNIHLPTDISLSAPAPSDRQRAVDVIHQVIQTCSPLLPSTHTLHIPYERDTADTKAVKEWQAQVYSGIKQLLEMGVDAGSLSIETLSYPLSWLDPIFEAFPLKVCIDIGHLSVQGMNCLEVFNRYRTRTSIIHLHGVKDKTDHLSLDNFSREEMNRVMEILKNYSRVVSLEVFSFKNLSVSLEVLESQWKRRENRSTFF